MRFWINATLVSTILLAASCSPPAIPSLEDVGIEVTPASADDWARYEKAMEPIHRAQFAGVTYYDARGRVEREFTDYDAYQAFLRDSLGPNRERQMPLWPALKMKLSTHRVLHDPKSNRTRVGFRFCDPGASRDASWGITDNFLLWRGKLVDRDRATEIARVIKSDTRAQEYEVFLTYVYYADERPSNTRGAVTLLPLPSDLCVSLARPAGFESFDYGPPKRLDRTIINNAVGVLPRLQATQ